MASMLFNEAWYLGNNSDVAVAVTRGETNALDHFVHFGLAEGRAFTPFFNADFYLASNPDVAVAVAAGEFTALSHFWYFGQYELRAFNPTIDMVSYALANADILAAHKEGMNVLDHFLIHGLGEPRDLGNGISLTQFANDAVYLRAVATGDTVAAMARIEEVAPFLPGFKAPAGWTLPSNTKVPTDFVPLPGESLVIPPHVNLPAKGSAKLEDEMDISSGKGKKTITFDLSLFDGIEEEEIQDYDFTLTAKLGNTGKTSKITTFSGTKLTEWAEVAEGLAGVGSDGKYKVDGVEYLLEKQGSALSVTVDLDKAPVDGAILGLIGVIGFELSADLIVGA